MKKLSLLITILLTVTLLSAAEGNPRRVLRSSSSSSDLSALRRLQETNSGNNDDLDHISTDVAEAVLSAEEEEEEEGNDTLGGLSFNSSARRPRRGSSPQVSPFTRRTERRVRPSLDLGISKVDQKLEELKKALEALAHLEVITSSGFFSKINTIDDVNKLLANRHLTPNPVKTIDTLTDEAFALIHKGLEAKYTALDKYNRILENKNHIETSRFWKARTKSAEDLVRMAPEIVKLVEKKREQATIAKRINHLRTLIERINLGIKESDQEQFDINNIRFQQALAENNQTELESLLNDMKNYLATRGIESRPSSRASSSSRAASRGASGSALSVPSPVSRRESSLGFSRPTSRNERERSRSVTFLSPPPIESQTGERRSPSMLPIFSPPGTDGDVHQTRFVFPYLSLEEAEAMYGPNSRSIIGEDGEPVSTALYSYTEQHKARLS